MKDDTSSSEHLPKTDIDSFEPYTWQMSSAVRPEWPRRTDLSLLRETYFGHHCLAEPAHGHKTGPPFVVVTYPAAIFYFRERTQKEVCYCFTREAAERAVHRYDHATESDYPTLFD